MKRIFDDKLHVKLYVNLQTYSSVNTVTEIHDKDSRPNDKMKLYKPSKIQP